MSDTQGSTRVGMLLAIVCVAGTFIAILIIAFRSGHRHEKAIQELARAEGWSFSRISTQEHTAKVEELFPEERFTLSYIMTVESDSRNVFLLDGSYRHRASRSGGQLASVCLIESSRFRSVGARVETIARTWTDEKLLSGQVDMGDSEFARSFVVLSRDPVSTKRTLNESIQTVLLARRRKPLYNPVQIALGTGKAALLTGYIAEPERWRDLVDLARQIGSTVR